MAARALPGQYLSYEREKRGISVAEVARALRLAEAVVTNLEQDDYTQLPEAVYVRGYIRAYCKFLKLDAAPVLALYQDGTTPGNRLVPEKNPKDAVVNEHIQRLTRIWGTIAVLVAVTLLLFLWWRETQLQRMSHTLPIRADAAQVGAAEEDTDPAETGSTMPNAPTTPSAATDTASGDWERAADTEEASAPVAEIPMLEDDALYADMKIVAATRSWTLIYDGARGEVIHRIIPAGYERSFDGLLLPLYFALGDARGIRLWIDGSEYDLSPHVHPLNHTAFFHFDKVAGE